MNFTGQIVLITGANRGIGFNISKTLANFGAYVIGTATSEDGVKIINNNLGTKGIGKILNFIDDTSSIINIVKFIIKKFRKIDILINNAGIINDNLLIKMTDHEWENVLKINLTSVFKISRIVIKYMLKKKFGRVITIGSVVNFIGNIGQINYSTSKAGIIGFSKTLAKEVASHGITVNVIAPGYINTDMTANISKNKKKKIIDQIPIKRFGNVKEVTNVVLFLASKKSSYITGETIHVNGGLYMS
ncbi:3-oxoacyl-ACP reductase FabG [Enterobacteriaceae endosymbiont of Neohaemonia nigricornis]|uniref:3-oxoacyl-ACP reductase FabG n=1 Tax=Enterobacteriaceae endosymbiont of Neohaemonia nigricornis TaxID=2675792 RepID=UPI00144938E5|nr:3-oxoacyl-ACP reductase FabG [Enterobacteriaceae endosymbiont of Neohaemonia nigricornis]QJC30282.1 SDR family oxidoreductase [Enterobacteriaceae endosymbiont of Neohaemonia nigricornis]